MTTATILVPAYKEEATILDILGRVAEQEADRLLRPHLQEDQGSPRYLRNVDDPGANDFPLTGIGRFRLGSGGHRVLLLAGNHQRLFAE